MAPASEVALDSYAEDLLRQYAAEYAGEAQTCSILVNQAQHI